MSYLLASRRRQTRWPRDWSSDVCSTDLVKVISTPTITPIEPTAVTDWEPVEPTEGWRETSASGEATAAIDSWATALTSSPGELKLATRDEDSSHVYATLTGVTASEASVSGAMSPEPKQGEVDASTLVATVSVQLVPEDPDDAEDDEDDDDDVEAEQVETTVT